jgi:hypothetical protein
MILQRYVVWSGMVHGIYFEIMRSFLLGSAAFAYAIWQDEDRWSRLASLAFALNPFACWDASAAHSPVRRGSMP